MSRQKRINKTANLHIEILASLNDRLVKTSNEIGKTKTQVIEEALFVYLNMIDKMLVVK